MVKPVKKPVVTVDEQKFRDELYTDVKTVKNKNILCTSCNGSLKELILKRKPKTHPFMDTLLCEKCSSFFGDGEFSVDEDGSDKYCRWCGQGGTLYLCSTCTAGFCKKCIKRNLPRAVLKEVEDDDWQCFCCNIKPLYELRAHCWAANKYASEFNEESKKKKGLSKVNDSSDESDEGESSKPKKRQKMEDSDDNKELVKNRGGRKPPKKPVGRKLRNNSQIYKPITSKLSATIKDAVSVGDLFKKKANDISSKKINLTYLRDSESVEKVIEKLDLYMLSVETVTKDLRTSMKEFYNDWKNQHSDKTTVDEDKGNGDDKKTINGVDEAQRTTEVGDELPSEAKDENNEKESSKIGMDLDGEASLDANETITTGKTNGSDSESDECETSRNGKDKIGNKFQDDSESTDKKTDHLDVQPSKKSKGESSSDENVDEDLAENEADSKKLAQNVGDGDN